MTHHHFVGFWFWNDGLGELTLLIGVSATICSQTAQVFKDFGVEDGRADFVDAHGPFAEVDFSAAITAERKVFVAEADKGCAGGAAEELGGFFSW
jgi:hypothetical protein